MAFIFLHIPKTGGTFVDSIVSASSVKSLHAVGTNKEKISLINSKNFDDQPEYIAGHMTMNILAECVDDLDSHIVVSLVRHPFDRFISGVNYLIEILGRGLEFYQQHALGAKMRILKTYFALQSEYCQDLTHLLDFESKNYIAKFLIQNNDLKKIEQADVSECVETLKQCISRYKFLMSLENDGGQKLLDYTCEKLKIDQSLLPSPKRNASQNYVNLYSLIKSGFIEYNRQNSRIDSLLYLMVHQGLSGDDLRSMTWEDISLKCEELFFRNSSYISKPCSKIPRNVTECVQKILE